MADQSHSKACKLYLLCEQEAKQTDGNPSYCITTDNYAHQPVCLEGRYHFICLCGRKWVLAILSLESGWILDHVTVYNVANV